MGGCWFTRRLRRQTISTTSETRPDIWANVFAYDTTKFPEGPTTVADFFDLEKFPGKRGLRKGAKAVLELALMGDGVPAAEVYSVLGTPEGVDRAFAKLDTIKSEVVWWEAGAQAPQLLADGEVANCTNSIASARFGAPFGTTNISFS